MRGGEQLTDLCDSNRAARGNRRRPQNAPDRHGRGARDTPSGRLYTETTVGIGSAADYPRPRERSLEMAREFSSDRPSANWSAFGVT